MKIATKTWKNPLHDVTDEEVEQYRKIVGIGWYNEDQRKIQELERIQQFCQENIGHIDEDLSEFIKDDTNIDYQAQGYLDGADTWVEHYDEINGVEYSRYVLLRALGITFDDLRDVYVRAIKDAIESQDEE
jgi:hypothetical protein